MWSREWGKQRHIQRRLGSRGEWEGCRGTGSRHLVRMGIRKGGKKEHLLLSQKGTVWGF